MQKHAVGIDLGTTNSCVGVFKDDKVEIIANAGGYRITPSFVAFTDEVRLIGDAAKEQAAMNPQNTVFNVKRLIGQKFNNPEVQKDIEQWPYNVVSSAGDRPMVQVEFQGEKKAFTPEQISAMVLEDLKKTAEDFLGGEVKNAVITVPAYFNDSQRRATKDAGKIAGFNVLGVLNEPTAAAIAYGLGKKGEGKKNVLIYDLGGGTFDVTILTMDNGVFDVKSTSGDVHLGGEDFDSRLVDYFAEQIEEKLDKDIKSDPRALCRLRKACEEAKRSFLSSTNGEINLDALIGGADYRGRISRERFENLCEDLFDKTLETVNDALSGAKMRKDEIDEVVLVGGSTRIPRIREMVSQFFNGKELSKSINPDEAVACGAAIQAALLIGEKSDMIGDLTLRDVTPLSLGVDKHGQIMVTAIPRNTKIPVQRSAEFHTILDNQSTLLFGVYEGERPYPSGNNLLGKLELHGLRPAPKGEVKAKVTFDIDANGILTASAMDVVTWKEHKITIQNGRLTNEEIDRMIKEAEKFKEADIAYQKKVEIEQKIEDLIYDIRKEIKRRRNDHTSYKYVAEVEADKVEERLINRIEVTKEWLDSTFYHLKAMLDQLKSS